MKLPTRAALVAWLCIVSSQRQADAAFQCVRRGDGSWTGLGTNYSSNVIEEIDANQLNLAAGTDFESGHRWLYSQRCGNEVGVLNSKAGTYYGCGNGVFVIRCSSGSYRRINQYLALDGCNNRTSAGWFVGAGNSGSCQCNTNYTCIKCQCNRVSSCAGHGVPRTSTFTDSASCNCDTNYTGANCQHNRTSACNNRGIPTENGGSCLGGCDTGYRGASCEYNRTHSCGGNGIPTADDGSCLGGCDTRYRGANCEYNRARTCNGDGNPTADDGSCLGGCDTGYRGASCEYNRARTCNGNGNLTSDDGSCLGGCDPGFHGARCEFSDFVDCNEAGFVDSAGVCTCIANVHGANCEHNRTNSCNGNGDPTSHDGTCLTGCDATFAGPHCEYSRVANCNNRGDPNDDGSCTGNCAGGYAGALCQHSRQDQCGGHGIPNDDGSCTGNCDVGYAGRACEHSRVTACSCKVAGSCEDPGLIPQHDGSCSACPDSYTGQNCQDCTETTHQRFAGSARCVPIDGVTACSDGQYSAAGSCARCPAGTYMNHGESNTGGYSVACTACGRGQLLPIGARSDSDCFFQFQPLGEPNTDGYCTGTGLDARGSQLSLISTEADCRAFAESAPPEVGVFTFVESTAPCIDVASTTECSTAVALGICTDTTAGIRVGGEFKPWSIACRVSCGSCGTPSTRCVIDGSDTGDLDMAAACAIPDPASECRDLADAAVCNNTGNIDNCGNPDVLIRLDNGSVVPWFEVCRVTCGSCIPATVLNTTCVTTLQANRNSTTQTVRYFDPSSSLLYVDAATSLPRAYTPVCTAYFCDQFGYDVSVAATADTPPSCTVGAAALAVQRAEEADDYNVFYITMGALLPVLLLCFCGVLALADGFNARTLFLGGLFGIRFTDLSSDWAFFCISLQEGSEFALVYEAAGNDYDAVWWCSLVFTLFGTVLFFLDAAGLLRQNRAAANGVKLDDRSARTGVAVAVGIFFLEDVPQLSLNGVYLNTLGFENADSVAKLSLAMGIISIFANIGLGVMQRPVTTSPTLLARWTAGQPRRRRSPTHPKLKSRLGASSLALRRPMRRSALAILTWRQCFK